MISYITVEKTNPYQQVIRKIKPILPLAQNWHLDDLGCSKDGAEVCPVHVIHVFEGGKKII